MGAGPDRCALSAGRNSPSTLSRETRTAQQNKVGHTLQSQNGRHCCRQCLGGSSFAVRHGLSEVDTAGSALQAAQQRRGAWWEDSGLPVRCACRSPTFQIGTHCHAVLHIVMQGSSAAAWSITSILGLAALIYGYLQLRSRRCAWGSRGPSGLQRPWEGRDPRPCPTVSPLGPSPCSDAKADGTKRGGGRVCGAGAHRRLWVRRRRTDQGRRSRPARGTSFGAAERRDGPGHAGAAQAAGRAGGDAVGAGHLGPGASWQGAWEGVWAHAAPTPARGFHGRGHGRRGGGWVCVWVGMGGGDVGEYGREGRGPRACRQTRGWLPSPPAL